MLHSCRSFSSFLLVSGALAACSGRTIVGPPAPPVASTPGNSSNDSVGASLASTCATATSHVTIAANLDADAPLIAEAWSAFDPFAATNYVTSTPIVDARGDEHELSVVFRRSGPHAYEYHALVDSYIDVASHQGGTEVSAGTLSFTAEGALDTTTESKSQPVKFEGIAAPQSIAVDFGGSMDEGGTGFTGTISVAADFAIAGQWHDGASCGETPEIAKPCIWPHPVATTHIVVAGNLDARMDQMPILTLPWNVAQAVATSNFTISTTIYDSLGAAHAMGLHFRRTSSGTWDYHAVLVASPGASTPATEVGGGSLSFDSSGELAGVRTSALLNLSFPDAMPNQLVTLDFGSSSTNAGGGGHMTELATASVSFGTTQDGRALTGNLLAGASLCN